MKNLKFKTAVLSTAFISTFAMSATNPANPTVGTDNTITSTGTLDIFLTINNVIQISDLDDINLGNYDPTMGGNTQGSDLFCVYSNTPSFTIRASSASGTGAYELQDSGANGYDNIPYSLEYAAVDETGTVDTYATLNHGADVSILERRTTTDCSGDGNNISVRATIEETDISSSFASDYTDTVTFVASPE